MEPLQHELEASYQVVNFTRFGVVNLDRSRVVSLNRTGVVNFIGFCSLAAVVYNNNGTENLYYVNSDHLGSPLQLTDNSQNVVEEYSFDAWGRRRNPADWTDYAVNPNNFILHRGYTMHEHIDEFAMINMNGRVYDPLLGRFIQPDNIVQNPDNISTFNRYSYVTNNPLKYIDPTGWGGQKPESIEQPGYNPGPTASGPAIYYDGMPVTEGSVFYNMLLGNIINGFGGGGFGSSGYTAYGSTGAGINSGVYVTAGGLMDAGFEYNNGMWSKQIDNSTTREISMATLIYNPGINEGGIAWQGDSKGDPPSKKSNSNDPKNLTKQFALPGVTVIQDPNLSQGYFNPITKTINIPGWIKDPAELRDYVRHEYGHYLQLKKYGYFDFFVVTLESIASSKKPFHMFTWPETEANKLSNDYFMSKTPTKYGAFFDSKKYKLK